MTTLASVVNDQCVSQRSSVLAAVVQHAIQNPEHPALVVVDAAGRPAEHLNYRQLAAISASRARTLAHTVSPGATVMLAAPNGLDFVGWFCAGMMAGVRLFPIHPCAAANEMATTAAQSAAAAIIAPDEMAGVSMLAIPRISLDLQPGANDAPRPIASANYPGIALQSSGTLGRPKIVLRDGPALDAVAINVARAAHLVPDDRILAAMPLCHSYGVDIMLAALMTGATLHIMPAFDAVAAAANLTDVASVFPGVPFMFEALARLGPVHPPSHLRLTFSAGTTLPERVFHAFQAEWTHPVGQLYGATELGSVTFNHPQTPDFNSASVGVPMPGVNVKILDSDDLNSEMAAGVDGHIAISAPSMLKGYLGDVHQHADGFFLTGDLGHVDQGGRLFVTGRLKLLIDVGGLKVNPLEVEEVLASHPNVAECIVVPLPLSDTVIRLRAIVVPRDPQRPPEVEELRQYLKDRLSRHKIPRVIEFAAALPRSKSGKILRHQVTDA